MGDTTKIKTLAFFDLESTGLPVLEFHKTKITELCLVACSVAHIQSAVSKIIPRVLHKLSFCLNPYRMINPISTNITGLDNFALENELSLNENTVKLLVHFLQQLQQPVCLVAHNGNHFDFPLLHKELSRMNMSLPDNLYCVDSIELFRKIDEIRLEAKQTKVLAPQPKLKQNVDNGPSKHDDEPNHQTAKDLMAEIAGDTSINWQLLNETTPQSKSGSGYATNLSKKSVQPLASKRKLFADTSTPKKSTKRFRLIDVHERLFGHLPETSHYAEADTLALLRCVVADRDAFLPLVQSEACLFSSAKKFYEK